MTQMEESWGDHEPGSQHEESGPGVVDLLLWSGVGGGSGNEDRVVGAGGMGWGRGKGACAGFSQTDSLLFQAVLPTVMVLPGFPGLLLGCLLGPLGNVPVRSEEASWAEEKGPCAAPSCNSIM